MSSILIEEFISHEGEIMFSRTRNACDSETTCTRSIPDTLHKVPGI